MHGFFLVFLIILVGCDRHDPYPERRDPIFADIEADLKDAGREVISLEKELASARAQIEAAQIQTGESKAKRSAFHDVQNKLDLAKQRQRYFELRKETRRQHARKAYIKAREEGEPWPDPQEFKDYMINKRLLSAPKNWDERLKQALDRKNDPKNP